MTPAVVALMLAPLLAGYHAGRVPEHMRHEDEPARLERMHDIAEAVVLACDNDPAPGWPIEACAALLATAAEWESGLTLDVHRGARRGPARELCLVQIHPSVVKLGLLTSEEWNATTGLGPDATFRCMTAGWKVLRRHIVRCGIRYENGGRWPVAMVFAEYHHPSPYCRATVLPMSTARAGTYVRLLRALRVPP